MILIQVAVGTVGIVAGAYVGLMASHLLVHTVVRRAVART